VHVAEAQRVAQVRRAALALAREAARRLAEDPDELLEGREREVAEQA